MGKTTERSLKIVLDGDASKFSESIAKATDYVKETKEEVNALRKSLLLEWDNKTFIQAQSAASEAVKATNDKVELLKKTLSQVDNDGSAQAQKQIKYLTVELMKAENAAKQAQNRLNEIAGMEFKQNLNNANSQIEKTTRNLSAMQSKLSMEWDNDTFVQAQNLSRQAVEKITDKVTLLRNEISKLEKEGISDSNIEQYEKLSVELNETELSAKQAFQQLKQINQIKFDRVEEKLHKISSLLLKAGAGLTAGVTLPLAYAGKQALETASDLTEAQNVIDVSFGKSSESVNKWSKNLLDSHGMAELTAKKYAGIFKSMANGMNIADEAGTEMSMTLTEMIPDVASFFDLQFEETGTKLKSIFTGETESLKEIGVIMTQANLNAYALSHGMEELSDDMTEADKVALRYSFVLDKLKDAQGDFGNTLDGSLANQTKQAQERFKALSAELAQELLPIATDLLKWANDCIKSFGDLTDSQKKTIITVLGLSSALGPVVTATGGIVKGCELGAGALKKIHTKMTSTKTATDAAAVSQAGLNAIMLANPYALIATAILAVGTALVVFSSQNDEVVQKTKELNDALKETTETYKSSIESVEKNANSQLAEVKLAERLIQRYDELNGKVNLSSSEKFELSSIVKQLNKLLGTEIKLVDKSAGFYDAQTESLYRLADARKEEIKQIALREKAIAAQKTLIDVEDKILEAQKNYDKAKKKYDTMNPWSITIFKEKAYHDAKRTLDELIQKKKELSEDIDIYSNYKSTVESPTSGMTQEEAQKYAESFRKPKQKSLEELEKELKQEKEMLDYKRNLNLISEEDYYKELKGLRENYYGGFHDDLSSHTDLQKQLNREIYNQEVALNNKRISSSKAYNAEQLKLEKEMQEKKKKILKEMYDNHKELAKETYEKNKKLLKETYDAEKKEIQEHYKTSKKLLEDKYKEDKKLLENNLSESQKLLEKSHEEELKAIEETYKAKQKAINDQIKAIDEEIAARRRLKKEEEFDSQIDELKAQLAYGKMDEFSRREIEAQIKRLEDEKADYEWELEQENKKKALNQELENAKELYEQQKADANELFKMKKLALQEEYKLNLEQLETTYSKNIEQLETTYQMNIQKLEETYALHIENLETSYKLHLKQLDTMFEKSSTQMNKISNDFVDTITRGCNEAAGVLSGILNQIYTASAQAERASSNIHYDNSSRTTNVYPSTGMTPQQVQRMIDRQIY